MAADRSYQKAIAKGLTRAFDDAEGAPEHVQLDELRWVVFSDHHKGSRDGADDFRRCERAYNAALAYYLELGYTLAVLGDVEELWECSPGEVLEQYEHTLELERKFHALGRYRRFWGNHDDAWRHGAEVTKHLQQKAKFTGLTVHEALRLEVRQDGADPGLIFLAHGHQGTAESDRFGWFSRIVVKVVWRPLQRRLNVPSTTPARDWDLRERHEAAMFAWARGHRAHPVLITGHTHRPVFGASAPKPKIARTAAEIQKELEDAVDREQVARLRAELEYVIAEERRVDRPQPIVPPCFFNTGCCSYGDGDITGLELADGHIRLVRWTCRDGAPRRDELDKDLLRDVFAAVSR